MQTQVAALNPDNPIAKAGSLIKPSRKSKPDISSGRTNCCARPTQAQIAAAQEARKVREQAQAAEDAQWLGAASSTAAEGGVALTERKFDQAATLFGQAAGYVPSGRRKERGDYLLRQVDALYREGGERGDNNALREAIEVCRKALAEYPRSEAPLQWANAQANLGNVLQTLGERESGKARLEDAVSAYRAALEELTRERVPIAWATTQNNLGAALLALGEREGGPAELEQAAEAFRAALGELTRDSGAARLGGDAEQSGLRAQGARRSGDRDDAARRDSVKAYRAALEVWTRERAPLQWAGTQNNLANALAYSGDAREREPSGWNRRRRLTARLSRYGRASSFRSIGP